MAKSTCLRGHALVPGNLVEALLRRGQRGCVACQRARDVVGRAARRGIELDLQELADEKFRQLMGLEDAAPLGPPPEGRPAPAVFGETWLPVLGLDGTYEVSNLGNVRSLARVVIRSDGRARRFPAVLLRAQTCRADGRRTVMIGPSGALTTRLVAPLVLEAFIGARPRGMQACHDNGDVADDRLENLRWDTVHGNMMDQQKHGTNWARNKTHCPRRHPLTAPNLVPGRISLGFRTCYACQRAEGKVRYWRSKGVALDLQAEADRYFDLLVSRAAA